MKVLLIQAYLGRKEEMGCIFPLGLCYIGTALVEAGHEVVILDPNLYKNPLEKVAATIKDVKAEVIGISLRNIDTTDYIDPYYYYGAFPDFLRVVRGAAGRANIVIGGSGFSLFPRTIMKRHDVLDYGVYLEGEGTIVDLLENFEAPERVRGIFYRSGSAIVFTGHRRFDQLRALPRPRRDLAEIEKYSWPLSVGVQSQRGCPLRCAYCTYPTLNGRELRARAAVDVVDEIEELVNRFNVTEVIFTDSVFNLLPGHTESICYELIRRRVNVRWSAWFDVYGLTDDLVNVASNAGCYRMCFSLDGATNRALRILKKRFSESQLKDVLRITRRHSDIDFRFSLFCSIPSQNLRDLAMTVALFAETHVGIRRSKCLLSWMRILPQTRIHQIAITEGVVARDDPLLPQSGECIRKLFYHDHKSSRLWIPFFIGLVKFLSFIRNMRKFMLGE